MITLQQRPQIESNLSFFAIITTTILSIFTPALLSPSPSSGGAPAYCCPTPAAPCRSAPGDRPSPGSTSSLRAAASSADPATCCGSRQADDDAPRAPASGPTRCLQLAPLRLPALHLAPYLAPPPPAGRR